METYSDYTLNVKSKKDYPTVVFAILWLCIFAFKGKDMYQNFFHFNFQPLLFALLFYIISAYFIYQLIWIITGETIFTVSNLRLIVKTVILGIKITRTYETNQMQDLKIEHDVKSNSYWGFTGFRFSSYQSDVITFNYNGRKVTLGLNLEKFDIEHLRNAIK